MGRQRISPVFAMLHLRAHLPFMIESAYFHVVLVELLVTECALVYQTIGKRPEI